MVFVNDTRDKRSLHSTFQVLQENLKDTDKKRNKPLLDIVDGQQRLTTLLLLVNSLNFLDMHKNGRKKPESFFSTLLGIPEFASEVRYNLADEGVVTRMIRPKTDSLAHTCNIRLDPSEFESWKRLLDLHTEKKRTRNNGIKGPTELLEENMCAMTSEWSKRTKTNRLEPLEFAKFIVEQCVFLSMYAFDLDEAYNIFVTVNSDLKQPLSDVDLLKGYMYSYLQNTQGDAVTDPDDLLKTLRKFGCWWDSVYQNYSMDQDDVDDTPEQHIRDTFVSVYRYHAVILQKDKCLTRSVGVQKDDLARSFLESTKSTSSAFFSFIKDDVKDPSTANEFVQDLLEFDEQWKMLFKKQILSKWKSKGKKTEDLAIKAWKAFRTLEYISSLGNHQLSNDLVPGDKKQIFSSWKSFVAAFIFKQRTITDGNKWKNFFELMIGLDKLMLLALTFSSYPAVVNFLSDRFKEYALSDSVVLNIPTRVAKSILDSYAERIKGCCERGYKQHPVFLRYVLCRLNIQDDTDVNALNLTALRTAEIDHILSTKIEDSSWTITPQAWQFAIFGEKS